MMYAGNIVHVPYPARPAVAGSRAAGFSLTELVIVLVIMGMLAAIAQPRLSDTLLRYRTRQTANRLALDLRLAQSEAVKRQQNVTVKFDVTSNYYELTGVANLDRSAADYRVQLGSNRSAADLLSASFGGAATVVFDRFGSPSSAGTAVVGVKKYQITVSVASLAGVVQVGSLTGR